MTLAELGARNIEAHKHAAQFRNTFGRGLSDFWDLFTGFNLVRFDDWLKTPDGVSCREHLRKRYGEKAVELIYALIKL